MVGKLEPLTPHFTSPMAGMAPLHHLTLAKVAPLAWPDWPDRWMKDKNGISGDGGETSYKSISKHRRLHHGCIGSLLSCISGGIQEKTIHQYIETKPIVEI